MILIAAGLAIAGFLIAFQAFGVVPAALHAIDLSKSATAVITDKSLSDDAKETAARKAAIAMLGAAFSILWRSGAAVLVSVLPIYIIGFMGAVTPGAVFAYLATWQVIAGASLICIPVMYLLGKRPKSTSAYSAMDQMLHKIAFSAPFVQTVATDIEDSAFGADIKDIPDRPPVFITSLPRAGTTVVLNALSDVPDVATHLYRDMPFIMAPLLWSRLSRGFAKEASLHERAHGDGIKVGFDSPEAFEEVIWRQFWPQKYGSAGINLWTDADKNPEAGAFFRLHFRKIIALRSGANGRYVSKNNGNIARLDLLPQMFPDATILVPLRDPGEHALSLFRQHNNFLEQHQRDPFIKRYMRDIGHLEFGDIHSPIRFQGFDDLTARLTPLDRDYWLAYWIAANRDVARHRDKVTLLPQSLLIASAQKILSGICADLDLQTQNTDFASHFRKIPPKAKAGDFDASLLEQAQDLYHSLTTSN